MENHKLSLLGRVNQQPIQLGSDGCFYTNQKINGAWLAVFTPLDGAMLLTTQPPTGFIGMSLDDLVANFEVKPEKISFLNMVGISLELWIEHSYSSESSLKLIARNITRNPLPLAMALSWADPENLEVPKCIKNANEILLEFNSFMIKGACSESRTHLTYCCGWDPAGSGEEIWDDFFMSGELLIFAET